MTRALDEPPVALATPDLKVLGTVCCLFAAVSYTVSNICLRYLADTAPLAWSMCVREVVGVLGVTPWLVWSWRRGGRCLPDARSFGWLLVSGLAAELVGNLGLMWSLRIVGLSVAIPVALGVSLASGALLGRLVLGEHVSRRSALALGMLIVSILALALGADQRPRILEVGAFHGALAVAVAVAAGGSYAWLAVSMRQAAMAGTPVPAMALVVCGTGVLTLGPLSLWQCGPAGLAAIPTREMSIMLVAGAMNLAGFLAFAKGLHLTSIVHANLLSASQVAMAAVAGMLLFQEVPNTWVVLGVVLTVVGMVLVDRPAEDEEPLSGV